MPRLQPLPLSRRAGVSQPLRPAPDPARLWFPAGLALWPTLGWVIDGWSGMVLAGVPVLAAIVLLAWAAGR